MKTTIRKPQCTLISKKPDFFFFFSIKYRHLFYFIISQTTDFVHYLNGDNRVDNLDLVMLSQYLLNEIDLSEKVLKLVDVNLDKVVDIADLALIKQYIMGDKVILGNK